MFEIEKTLGKRVRRRGLPSTLTALSAVNAKLLTRLKLVYFELTARSSKDLCYQKIFNEVLRALWNGERCHGVLMEPRYLRFSLMPLIGLCHGLLSSMYARVAWTFPV